MKILADENFPGLAVRQLRELGHDVVWIKTDLPGAVDTVVFDQARNEGRILLTLDKDFGDLAFRQMRPLSSGIVLFRLPLLSPETAANIIVSALAERKDWQGHFSVIEPGRIRMVKIAR